VADFGLGHDQGVARCHGVFQEVRRSEGASPDAGADLLGEIGETVILLRGCGGVIYGASSPPLIGA
jgi:hypothetical protein